MTKYQDEDAAERTNTAEIGSAIETDMNLRHRGAYLSVNTTTFVGLLTCMGLLTGLIVLGWQQEGPLLAGTVFVGELGWLAWMYERNRPCVGRGKRAVGEQSACAQPVSQVFGSKRQVQNNYFAARSNENVLNEQCVGELPFRREAELKTQSEAQEALLGACTMELAELQGQLQGAVDQQAQEKTQTLSLSLTLEATRQDLSGAKLTNSEFKKRVDTVPVPLLHKYFLKGKEDRACFVRVRQELQQYLTFKRINLLEETWPISPNVRFDIIFCLNVMIYFDKPTRQRLFARYAERLRPGGYLFIGHSESLLGISDAFESLGKTMYRLPETPKPAARGVGLKPSSCLLSPQLADR